LRDEKLVEIDNPADNLELNKHGRNYGKF